MFSHLGPRNPFRSQDPEVESLFSQFIVRFRFFQWPMAVDCHSARRLLSAREDAFVTGKEILRRKEEYVAKTHGIGRTGNGDFLV